MEMENKCKKHEMEWTGGEGGCFMCREETRLQTLEEVEKVIRIYCEGNININLEWIKDDILQQLNKMKL